ncbi:hypothetical protein Tco_1344742 [Tanacetum coccineum]
MDTRETCMKKKKRDRKIQRWRKKIDRKKIMMMMKLRRGYLIAFHGDTTKSETVAQPPGEVGRGEQEFWGGARSPGLWVVGFGGVGLWGCMSLRPITQAAIEKLISDRVAAALAQDRATRETLMEPADPAVISGEMLKGKVGHHLLVNVRTQVHKNVNPTSFHGNEGAVELSCWFEKTESEFQHQRMCREKQGERIPYSFAYTQRFNEFGLAMPGNGSSENKNVEAYVQGLPENIKEKPLLLGLLFILKLSNGSYLTGAKVQAKLKELSGEQQE